MNEVGINIIEVANQLLYSMGLNEEALGLLNCRWDVIEEIEDEKSYIQLTHGIIYQVSLPTNLESDQVNDIRKHLFEYGLESEYINKERLYIKAKELSTLSPIATIEDIECAKQAIETQMKYIVQREKGIDWFKKNYPEISIQEI